MTRLVRRPAVALVVSLAGGILVAACDSPSPDPDAACSAVATTIPEAEPDPEQDDWVDGQSGPGWVAGDSTYSLPLPDGRVLWMYSDSVIGSVNRRGEAKPGNTMVHNAIVVQERDGTLRTLTGTKDGKPSSFFPDVSADTYYWVQDAAVEGDKVTVFLSRTKGKGADFRWTGTSVAQIRISDLSLLGVTETKPVGNIAWGAAVMETEKQTYVYGIEDVRGGGKYLHLAKVPAGGLTDRSRWEYRAKTTWSADPSQAARITDGVANELSVQPYQDGYLMVSSDTTGIFSPKINAYTACDPHGPWSTPRTIYETPESGQGEHFTYNAHAHPGLPGRDDDQLLVSYNVNTFDTDELFKTPSVYRPRFVTLDLP